MQTTTPLLIYQKIIIRAYFKSLFLLNLSNISYCDHKIVLYNYSYRLKVYFEYTIISSIQDREYFCKLIVQDQNLKALHTDFLNNLI